MDAEAIAAQALGHAGLGMLTTDFGRPPPGGTRLAEILRAPGEARLAAAGRREDRARATRP